jgi:hypothetical protein
MKPKSFGIRFDFPLDRIRSGFVGVYATYTGGRGIAETKIDGLRVERR